MNAESGAELSLPHVLRPEMIAADPYPLNHRLRSEDPVRWDAPLNAWVVTRYADVQSALGDARLSAWRQEHANLSCRLDKQINARDRSAGVRPAALDVK